MKPGSRSFLYRPTLPLYMPNHSELKERLVFLESFIKNPKQVGSFTPSSQYLKKSMMKHIDFSKARFIAEYGAGTGTFTKELLKLARKDAKILCFETNKGFCKYLKKIHDPRLIVINDGAQNIIRYLKKHNISSVDYVVSSLPFLHLDEKTKENIMKATNQALDAKGTFITYRYTLTFSEFLKYYFKRISRVFVPLNLPPTFVYVCQK